jgi:hypothetical protein
MLNTPKSALIAAASIFAVSGLALSPSFAQQTGSINPVNVIVQRIDALNNDEKRTYENLSPDQLSMAQEKISANPSLVSALTAQGVNPKDVVKVIEFPNGSALVYQR